MNLLTKRCQTAAAALALTCAGCAGAGGGHGIPTAGRSDRRPSPQPAGDLDQALINYAHCMRGRGVTISDPAPSPGHTGLSLDPPNMSIPGVAEADAQCQHLL